MDGLKEDEEYEKAHLLLFAKVFGTSTKHRCRREWLPIKAACTRKSFTFSSVGISHYS